MTDPAQAWRDFCAKLADAGEIILAPDVPDDPLIRAEGFRYLSRLTNAAKKLQAEGFLLDEDVTRIIERASAK